MRKILDTTCLNERETFASRLGFVLISAGGAIGLGNVERFPYIVGQYGGAAFVLIYLVFLVIMGLPIMAMEFAVGRASRRSIAGSFHVLEPKGSKWHWYSWFGMAGNYMLMMFYTTMAGWMILYFVKMARGDFAGLDTAGVAEQFGTLMGQPGVMLAFMGIVVLLGMGAVASVLGILGDLFASSVKRQVGIKDYGTIFPGHGGILDRFDSVMFIAPFVSIAVRYFFYLL